MRDRPQAKLVEYIPSGKSLPYWDRYVYECVDCGAHYERGTNNSRINPYCGICARKHDAERQKENKLKKQAEHDAKVRADAIEECIAITRKGLKELCQSPYAERHYPMAKECFEIVDDLIVKKDLEKLKEQKNG